MANAKHDENGVATKLAVLNTDGVTTINLVVDPSTHRLKMSNGTTDAFIVPGTLISGITPENTTSADLNGSVTAVGQSILGTGIAIGTCNFYGRIQGSPTGYAYAKIYAHSGVFGTSSVPTGPALATSDAVDVSTFSSAFSTSAVVSPFFYFTGVNQITLTNGTPYVIVLEYTNGSLSPFKAIRPQIRGSDIGLGNYSYYDGTWHPIIYYDLGYQLYDNVVVTQVPNNAIHDQNAVPSVTGVLSSDNETVNAALCNSSGYLLVQSI